MGLRRAVSCFHFTSKRCRAPPCSTFCPVPPHTPPLFTLALSSHQHLSSQTLTRAVSVTARGLACPGRLQRSQRAAAGVTEEWDCGCASAHRQQHSLGTSSWIRGCNVLYKSYRVGGKGHLPKIAVSSLNPFFLLIIIIIAVTLVCFRACLLFIKEGFALSLTLCTMD